MTRCPNCMAIMSRQNLDNIEFKFIREWKCYRCEKEFCKMCLGSASLHSDTHGFFSFYTLKGFNSWSCDSVGIFTEESYWHKRLEYKREMALGMKLLLLIPCLAIFSLALCIYSLSDIVVESIGFSGSIRVNSQYC